MTLAFLSLSPTNQIHVSFAAPNPSQNLDFCLKTVPKLKNVKKRTRTFEPQTPFWGNLQQTKEKKQNQTQPLARLLEECLWGHETFATRVEKKSPFFRNADLQTL